MVYRPKLSSAPILGCCSLNPREQILIKFKWKYISFLDSLHSPKGRHWNHLTTPTMHQTTEMCMHFCYITVHCGISDCCIVVFLQHALWNTMEFRFGNMSPQCIAVYSQSIAADAFPKPANYKRVTSVNCRPCLVQHCQSYSQQARTMWQFINFRKRIWICKYLSNVCRRLSRPRHVKWCSFLRSGLRWRVVSGAWWV